MTMPAIAQLLDAGATLAALAEPDRDLSDVAADLEAIACSLTMLAKGLRASEERGAEMFIATSGPVHAAQRRDNEWKKARVTAARTAAMAIVDLGRVVVELDPRAAAGGGR